MVNWLMGFLWNQHPSVSDAHFPSERLLNQILSSPKAALRIIYRRSPRRMFHRSSFIPSGTLDFLHKGSGCEASCMVPVINRVWRPHWSRRYGHTASERGHNCSYFLLCSHSGVMYSSNAERWGGANWLICGYLWILAGASWFTVPCVGGYAFIQWKIYSITSLSTESACLIYPVASVLPRCPWLR